MKNKISFDSAITLCNIGVAIALCFWMYSISSQHKVTTKSLVRIESSQVKLNPESKESQLKHEKTVALIDKMNEDLTFIIKELKLRNSK
tara:strand:+ start:798 stop:1064 length:267 start_codon:yes stop_codon:yes gene_type:complete